MPGSTSFFTVAQFAAHLGLSDKTLRRRIREGSLPYFQPGGPKTKILIPADALHQRADIPLSGREITPNQAEPFNEQEPRPALPGPKPRWR
jgi:excisionase family DNA binding protein